jgi:mono/diheme cytochrome c family protein
MAPPLAAWLLLPILGGGTEAFVTDNRGDARETIGARVTLPRQGVMPNWNHRLDPATIKAVTLYIHAPGGGE